MLVALKIPYDLSTIEKHILVSGTFNKTVNLYYSTFP